MWERLERVLDLAERALAEHVPDPPTAAELARHPAFRWAVEHGRGRLVPIPHPALFDLDDLIGVEASVRALDRNTRQLVAGLPCNDVLLYGERGTGKSSSWRGGCQV